MFPTYQVSKFASEHVKVVLGGDGADELFFGYGTFMLADKLALLDTVIGKMGNEIVHLVSKLLPISPQNFSLDFKLLYIYVAKERSRRGITVRATQR